VYILDEVEDAMILGLSFINHQQKRKGKKHERILAIMSSMASSTPPNSRLRGRDQRGKRVVAPMAIPSLVVLCCSSQQRRVQWMWISGIALG
jgi:hypothetical protein